MTLEPYEATHTTRIGDVATVPVNLFGAHNALAVIEAAAEMAKPLADIIKEQKLYADIRNRRHVRVEGWTLLGSMLGVFPVVCWSRPMEDGWEARVEARTRDGAVVGAAEAECLRSEPTWRDRDDYALRSMAQTRATSKALRLPLGFVIQLAGFETTPAEEMPADDAPSGPPCPHCGAPAIFTEEKNRHRPGKRDLPPWSCSNQGCGGGGPRRDGGNWPWCAWESDFFARKDDEETGGDIKQIETLPGPAPAVPQGAFDDLTVNLDVLGISREQAEAELEAFRLNSGFAAGHVKDMRERVNRACVLLVALGLEPEGVQGELWREWQAADLEQRRILTWGTVRGSEVQSFAAHVQAFLRVRG